MIAKGIAKSSRLPRSEFRSRGYRAFATPFFSIKVKRNTKLVNRLGVIVGKSVDKRAVRRNALRRQAKPIVAKATNIAGSGFDLILTIFPKANTLNKKGFSDELQHILEKAL